MLSYIIWDIRPEIFNIWFLEIRWYGLMFVLAFYSGYLIGRNMFRKEGVPEKTLDNLVVWVIVATIIGARLGHTLFYEPDYYLSNPVEILKIWEGGLASHGAAITIVPALWWFARRQQWDLVWLLDRTSVVVALAGFFIRMGNLFNSEIYGKPTTLPWGFIFTRVDNIPRHPAQLYEALSYLFIFIFLYQYYLRSKYKPQRGFLFAWFLILVFGARILIEFLKAPQVLFEQTMTLNMGQWLSIPMVISGILVLILTGLRKEKSQDQDLR